MCSFNSYVLSELVLAAGEVISGERIARGYGFSRSAVWKAIRELRGQGYDIETIPNRGYRYSGACDKLLSGVIAQRMKTKRLGKVLRLLPEVGSTSSYIKELAIKEQLPDGYTVVAEHQTGGRGRRGRGFVCAPGSGIYMSLLLRPRITTEELPFITICAAVAVSNALKDCCGFEPQIKWVNDIFYAGRKLCGILTEAVVGAEVGEIDQVVVGIGVNTGVLPEEMREIAISTLEITGRSGMRNDIIAAILTEFERLVDSFTVGARQEILRQYRSRSCVLARPLLVSAPGSQPYRATGEEIDEDGRLVVLLDDGSRQTLNSGEVSLSLTGGSL